MQAIFRAPLRFTTSPIHPEIESASSLPPQGSSGKRSSSATAWDGFYLILLTAAALLVHGYHIGIEDMAVYLPAIKKLLHPSLYPYDANFFLLYTQWTSFHHFVA